MIRVEINTLTNNIVLPFQNIREDHFLDFIELNKLIAVIFIFSLLVVIFNFLSDVLIAFLDPRIRFK